MDWFRWHHGSVTDPKFALIAKKAGARLSDVLAVWAYLLERASAADTRGCFGEIDCEAWDCLFGFDDGLTASILGAMTGRNIIADQSVVAWERRQPKREREDSTAADRQANKRARDKANTNQQHPDNASDSNVTPSHATSHQEKPRGEESREEQEEEIAKTGSADSSPSSIANAGANGAQTSQPLPDSCPHQDIIALYHAALPMGRQVRDWTPARAQHLKARWREDKKRQTLAWWEKFFRYVSQSAFLTGKSSSQNRRPFELGLDWLVKSENFVKTLEGAYHEAEVPA